MKNLMRNNNKKLLAAFLSLIIFAGTLLPNLSPTAEAAANNQSITAAATANEIYEGLNYSKNTIQNDGASDVNTYVLEVDPGKLAIETGVPNDEVPLQVGERQITKDQAVAARSHGKNVLAAVNADFFHINDDTKIQPQGVTVREGEQLTPYRPEHMFFGVLDNGTSVIGDEAVFEQVKDDLAHAVGADAGYLIKDGTIDSSVRDGVEPDVLHPRTAVGIKADGSVVFVVADGRSTISAGLGLGNLAEYMLTLGVVTAVNLDGGGSTTLDMLNPDSGEMVTENVPSGGSERPVGTTLLIIDPNSSPDTVNLEVDTDGYYLIKSARDLSKINYDPNANYRLANDIDLAGVALGKISVLNGSFDGNGHTIANYSSDSALFDTLSEDASVSDLRLTDVEITGDANAAALAGTSSGAISGITVTGMISGSTIVGGIVGTLTGGGSVKNSSVGAALTQTASTGGVGGIAGVIAAKNSGTIENVYANIDIKAAYRAGGIVAYGASNADSHIYNAIVEGKIHDTGIEPGGIGGLLQIGVRNSIIRDMTITSTSTAAVSTGNVAGFIGGWVNGTQPYQNNVILSGSITMTSPGVANRIGYHNTNKLSNYVNPEVTINGNVVTTNLGHNTVEGANATVDQLESQAFYEGLDFDFTTIFEWDAVNHTPALRNVDMTVDYAPYLSENTMHLYTGDVSNISAGATPVSVMSSNDAVASIDASGNVTAISPGKAIVTLIDSENNKVMRRIIVQAPSLTAYPISVSKLDNGKLLASANVANHAATAYTPTVVFSVYNEAGQLLETQTVENVQIALNSDNMYQVEFDDNEDASYIKMNVFPTDMNAVTLTKEMTYSIGIWKDFVTAIPNSTDHNALFTFNDLDTIITFRTYAKPVSDFGPQTWRFGYSNAIDSKGVFGVPLELGSDFEILSANIADGGTTPDGSIAGAIEPVTFGGQTAKSVAAGEQFWSDEVDYNLPQDHYLAFTWVLRVKEDGGSIPYSTSSATRMPSYRYYGDHGTQTASTGFGEQSTITLAPDVFAVKKTVNKRMTFLGDSITHGATASLGQDAFWVANIARALAQDGIAVRNDGLSGGVAYHAAEDGYWLSRVKGSDEVSIMLGTNDINRDRTKNEVLADLRAIIASIRAANPNAIVTLFTVPPFHVDTATRQKTWLEVNAYMKDRGTKDSADDGLGADYVFDVSPIWSDGTSPWTMKTEYKAGTSDYHPNDAGSAALSDAYLAWYKTRDNPQNDEITLEQDTDGYYLIETAEHLAEVNEHPTFNYRLANDIDLDGIRLHSVYNFSGDFDGNGHMISNMNIGSPLFAVLSEEGKIRDLRMDNATVIAGNNAAVLVGSNYGAIEGVAIHNAVVEGGSNTGGIVGQFVSGSIKNSSVGAKITGANPVGGIAGGTAIAGTTPAASTIEGCYANVDITANGRAGGIIGYASANAANHVYNCIVDGNIVEYGNSAGGIGGLIQIGIENSIVRNMSIITTNTSVAAGSGNVAGLLGGWINGAQSYKNNVVLDGSIAITSPGEAHRIGYHAHNKSNNYVNADVTINGSKVTAGIGHNTIEGADATLAEMRTQAFFANLGYDFATIFDWDPVNLTPVLRGVDMTVEMPDPKIALEQLIETAQSKVEDEYKADSWALFKAALDKSVVLMDDALATNQQIIAASNTLKTTMEQLVPNIASIDHVLLFVGSDETSRNVTWYSTSTNPGKVQVALKSAMTDDAFPMAYQEFPSTIQSTQVATYNSNKAVVTGLSANTEYVYRVGSDEGWSDMYSFKTLDFDDDGFSFLFAGDPQIGSSGNLGKDEMGWENTLDKANEWFPNISFLVSAGDQVETYYNESHYESFINPEALRSLTLATTIGNHDTLGVNYKEHFFVPNESEDLGHTLAGGNYWYSYNDVLFMVLNTNNLSTAEHQAFLTSAIAAYKEQNGGKDPLWKVVTLHHSIYSTAGHAVNADILQRRSELSPIMNNFGIDAVLMGHDHVYTRSYMMDGTTPITDGYTAANGDDYAIYTKTEDSDAVLYLTANSASGSKFYSTLVNEPFPYAAIKNQENTANITKIDVTESSLTFTTYRTGENNTVNDVLDTFTLKRPTTGPVVTDVTVSPSTATVQQGGTQSFSAAVNGANEPAQTVAWSVDGTSNTGTTISDSGVLTVAADEMADVLTIQATSTADTTKFGTATVTVTADTSTDTDVIVTFNSNGSVYAAKTVTAGDRIGSEAWPTDPARDSYTFEGWFAGENGTGTSFTPETPVTATMTVYAHWTYSGDTIVTDVAVSPLTATVQQGGTQSFSATVNGEDGLDQSVTWSVYGTGNAGTTITDSGVLTVAADEMANVLTVKAISKVDTTKFGTATVTVETNTAIEDVTVTFSSNGSVHAARTVSMGDRIGSEAWPTAPGRSSYTFGGWFTGENGAGTPFTSETPVTATMTVYAYWTYSGGSSVGDGGSGGDNGSVPPAVEVDVITENGVEMKLPVTVNKDNRTISIDASTYPLQSGSAAITLPATPGIDTYSIGLLVSELSSPNGQSTLTVNGDNVSITIPANMLTGISGISGSKAEVSFGYGDKGTLKEDVKAAIGDKPLIQLTLSIDGQQIDWSNQDVSVHVSIPYVPTAAERANPESIVVWYIDDNGNVETIPNGQYNAVTGTVTFGITHFSNYAVAYNEVDFDDVTAGAWYYDAVNFIAAREITTGTGEGQYSPEAKLTRGQFIVLIMRSFGIAPDGNPTSNFFDAGDTYYTGYLAAAKRLGISSGVSNNLYAPDREITRQEMFTLLYNTLHVIGQLPTGDSGRKLSDFSDRGEIDTWAKDAMALLVRAGIVAGNEGKIDPTGTTTRAEMAQVLYNLLRK